MLIWEDPKPVHDWVDAQGGGHCAPGTYSAIGYVEGGELTGGLVFYNANKKNVFVNIALAGGKFPRPLLRAGLFYVFHQLALRRLTFIISPENIRSQNLVTRLGARREATLREAGDDGRDLYIYSLFPEDCYIWSVLNGKILRRAAEPRSEGDNSPARAGESENLRLPACGDADEYRRSVRNADVEPVSAV